MTELERNAVLLDEPADTRLASWPKWPRLAIAALLAIGSVSLARGVLNAQSGSQDFQWSPTVLLLRGINPYAHQLAGNPGGEIIMTQAPNYAHVLYVLLIPFGMLDWTAAKWAWAFTNAGLGLVTCLVLCRIFRLSPRLSAVAVAVFVCSTPLRVCIGNGQHAVLVLSLLSLLFFSRHPAGKVVGGIGYAKYSFAPPFFFYEFLKNGPWAAIVTCLAGGAGVVVFMLISGDWRPAVIVQPLVVSRTISVGNGDLMSWLDVTIGRSAIPAVLYIGLPVILSGLAAFYAARSKLRYDYAFAFLCCAALVLFTHLTYDYVFLLPAFLISLRDFRQPAAKVVLAGVAYHWFVLKGVDIAAASAGWIPNDVAMVGAGLAANAALTAGVCLLGRRPTTV